MKKYILSVLSLCAFLFTNGQEVENVKNTFKGTRFVNSQSSNLADKGELLLLIQHRFGDISGGMYEFFGLDQASMRLGFEYGFGNNINLGIGRSTFFKTYDAFGKFRFVQQSNSFPFTLVATVGGSIPSIRNVFQSQNDNFSDKFSGNAQLHIARTFNSIGIQISPGYLKSGFLPYENKEISTLTLGLGTSAKLSNKISVNIEYLYDFNEINSNKRPLSAGIDLDTGGHLFQLVFSNSQRMFDQAIHTNTSGDWAKGKVYFGFNLIREFDINKDIVF